MSNEVNENLFELNDNLKINTVYLTDDQNNNQKIIVIDNFFKNIDKIKKLSHELRFTNNITVYPGKKKHFKFHDFHNFNTKIINKLRPYLGNKNISNMFFGFINKTKYINSINSMPHIDSGKGNNQALLIYLNENNNCYGGTGFYRNRFLNLIEISSENQSKFHSQLKIERLKNLKLNNTFSSDSTESFELIKLIKMKKNRAILYKGNILHSIYCKNIDDFNSSGRNTLNLFFGTKQIHTITDISFLEEKKSNIPKWSSDSDYD